jgi:hypothetical protein
MEPLVGWAGGVPGMKMCVRAYERRVSVVDVRVYLLLPRPPRYSPGVFSALSSVFRRVSRDVPSLLSIWLLTLCADAREL